MTPIYKIFIQKKFAPMCVFYAPRSQKLKQKVAARSSFCLESSQIGPFLLENGVFYPKIAEKGPKKPVFGVFLPKMRPLLRNFSNFRDFKDS